MMGTFRFPSLHRGASARPGKTARRHRPSPGWRGKLNVPLWLGVLAASLAFAGCGGGTEVEAVRPRRGEIHESFTEPARTRLARTYPIGMPIGGRIARIALEPGDPVKAGQPLVEFDLVPLDQAVAEAKAAVAELRAEITVKEDTRIEKTAADEANATVKAADEALKAADAEVSAQRVRSDRAARDLERTRQLAAKKIASEDALDVAAVAAETALIELRKQEFYRTALHALVTAVNLGPRAISQYIDRKGLEREVLVHRLAQAQARLARAEHERKLADVRSPLAGVVLERHEQGDRTLAAGQPLLLLGNLDDLEAVADVLTQDALRLAEGSKVSLEPAVRREPIPGKVRRIEPAGFVKLSSLGVEQQRVRVLIAIEGPHEGLGVGYHVQARFLTAVKSDALIVPRFSVLQAPDQSYYVLKILGERLHRQPVKLGLRSDLELEVTAGLAASDLIVSRPDATLAEGARVRIIGGGD